MNKLKSSRVIKRGVLVIIAILMLSTSVFANFYQEISPNGRWVVHDIGTYALYQAYRNKVRIVEEKVAAVQEIKNNKPYFDDNPVGTATIESITGIALSAGGVVLYAYSWLAGDPIAYDAGLTYGSEGLQTLANVKASLDSSRSAADRYYIQLADAKAELIEAQMAKTTAYRQFFNYGRDNRTVTLNGKYLEYYWPKH